MRHEHLDPDGVCNPGRLEKAAGHALDALSEIGTAVNADVATHIEAAKSKLN